MYPLPVLTGKEKYPDGVIEALEKEVENVKVVNARKVAEDLGEIKTQNIVMLGCLVKALELENIDWIKLIKENLPERVHEINIKAFENGMNL